MRHRHGYRKLGRTSAHRKALLQNLAIALFEHGSIETTVEKAKELRRFAERLITKSRNADFNTHRYIFANLEIRKQQKNLLVK